MRVTLMKDPRDTLRQPSKEGVLRWGVIHMPVTLQDKTLKDTVRKGHLGSCWVVPKAQVERLLGHPYQSYVVDRSPVNTHWLFSNVHPSTLVRILYMPNALLYIKWYGDWNRDTHLAIPFTSKLGSSGPGKLCKDKQHWDKGCCWLAFNTNVT